MIESKTDDLPSKEIAVNTTIPISFHPTFSGVYDKLKKWLSRFSQTVDQSAFTDLILLYLLATKKFLEHRRTSHLFRLVMSIHLMQKKLLHAATFFPHLRHLEIRWIPTSLFFPFSSKPVLGCLIGFNVMDRYELFDEENILLALQKHLPELRLVKDSSYCHTSQNKNLKVFYLEIEKKDGSYFSLLDKSLLKNNLEEKVKNSIQILAPSIFMGHNEEEIYKNILVLSQEIRSPQDLPQASISLFQQTKKEIVFRITLVQVTPFHPFSLKDRFFGCSFVPQRTLTVRHLEFHPIEAHLFTLKLPREVSLLRSDGSLDFYKARQKIVSLLKDAVGEFRDYNGGIIIKQQELLQSFKEQFPEVANRDPELMESFFYAVTPLEQQVFLKQDILAKLFSYYLENRKQKLAKGSTYAIKTYFGEHNIFIVIQGDNASLAKSITAVVQEQSFKTHDIAYAIIDTPEGILFSGVLLNSDIKKRDAFIEALKQSLQTWHQKAKERQILRIGLEYTVVSLDPRIGADAISCEVTRLLFEGLTRFNQKGLIEYAVAESVTISPRYDEYTFKFRPCLWNDGSPVSAYDFEYAWKKVLSPDFKTAFAYMFDPIKNAREAKEGIVSPEQIGIHVIDDRTLKVELAHPTPYFLELTAHPLYSPVHRHIDQQHPQWPYQCEQHYPCNGPFELKINQPDQGYQLVKNPYYRDSSQIVLDQITLTVMNGTQGYQAFQKKEIDWVGNPFGGWHSFFRAGTDERVASFPNTWVVWCTFNTKYPPLHHPKLRRAFAYAIDRAQIVSGAYLNLNPAYSPLLPHSQEVTPRYFPDRDMDKAKQLFAEALDELGMRCEDLNRFTLLFHEKGIREYTALCLQKQFKEVLGIDCELRGLPWSKMFPQMTGGNFQLGIWHWTPWFNDPIYTLNSFKSATHGVNCTKWEHPEFKRLVELSEMEINQSHRAAYLLKAEEILCQEVPVVPLFYQPSQALVTQDLQVSDKNPCGFINIDRSFYSKKSEVRIQNSEV